MRIDSLTFITNKGTKSPKYGGDKGIYRLVTIPQDYRIVGFFGTQGATGLSGPQPAPNSVYKLGFMLAKTIYPGDDVKHKNIQILL